MKKNQKGQKTPFAYALNLLSKKDRTQKEIANRLESQGFLSQEINTAVEELKKYGYLDDRIYCRNWLSWHERNRPVGKQYAYQKLKNAGIDKLVIEEELSTFYTEDNELESARQLVEKRLRNEHSVSLKEKAKLFRYLQGKGFSRSISIKAVDSVTENQDTRHDVS